MAQETVETAIYRLRVEGQKELDNLKSSLDGVTVSEQKAEPAVRATTAALEKRTARLDPIIRAQQAYRKELEMAEKFAMAGAGSATQRSAYIEAATKRYNEQVAAIQRNTTATVQGANATRLASHELINLSRQAQDVAVSLGSGQSFGTVLLQQGTQIADIFASSGATLRGAMSGIVSSLRSIFTVGRVAFGGIIAGAAGAAFATSDYLSQQKEVERALIGAGRRSASVGDINRIADQRSSPTGLSVSETREAALEFARTGQIHSRVIGEKIETTKNFALVTGQSSKEAAAALAKAFTDMSGIDALNKQFNFLDGTTRNYIEGLLLAGRTTEAAAVANNSLSVVLKQVEATQGGLEKGWTAIANAASNAAGAVGEYIAKAAGLQRQSKLDSAVGVAKEIEGLQSQVDRGDFGDTLGDTTILNKVKSDIEELRSKLRQLNAELGSIDASSFNAISTAAQQAVNSLNPFRGKILEVEVAVARIKAAMAAGFLNPELGQSLAQYELILQNLKNQEAALESLRAKHAGMTDQFAKQVESLEQQNRLLKARENGTEASVSAAIAYENAIAAGANSTEAAAIKALTLKNNLLQAASAASNLQLQLERIDSASDPESERTGAYSYFSTPATMGRMEIEGPGPFKQALEQIQRQLRRDDEIPASLREALSRSGPIDYTFQGNLGDVPINALNKGREDLRQFVVSQRSAMRNAEAQFLGGSSDKEDKIRGMQLQIEALKEDLKLNPENIWPIRGLERSIEELRNAVEENTDALNKVALNPLYTEGRSALKLGYMGAASGLDMMVRGGTPGVDSVPIHIMAQQGERVQVTPANQTVSNDNSKPPLVVNNTITVVETGKTNRRSSRQVGQKYGQLMASLS
jgi:hypothetical protein